MSSDLINRPRQSPWPAIPMDEALRIVCENAGRPTIIDVKLRDLRAGDVLARDFCSPWPHPRFRTSRMDGYALKSSDGIGNFNVLDGIEAGTSACHLQIPSRHCFRINTGGVVPNDADCVIPVEFTKLIEHDGQNELIIEVHEQMTSGRNIRQIGSDTAQNALLITKDSELGAAELALLASCGPTSVEIYQRPRIGVLSSGDELLDPFEEDSCRDGLREGQIYDSNRVMLIEMLRTRGCVVWDGGIVADSREQLKLKILQSFDHCDVLVLSGGVSMGDKDLLKSVLLNQLHLKIHFGRVFMKPGLPTTFATARLQCGKQMIVFGLPGNPVSAFVSTHLFVLPLIRHRMGLKWNKAVGTIIRVKLNRDYNLDPRPEYIRASLRFSDAGLPSGDIIESNQVSSRLMSVSNVNLLLKLPPKSDERLGLKEGEIVEAIIIDRV